MNLFADISTGILILISTIPSTFLQLAGTHYISDQYTITESTVITNQFCYQPYLTFFGKLLRGGNCCIVAIKINTSVNLQIH